ncbi:MAG: hypothetical protein VXX14_00375, partial [Pseudomonadota bacterium]|nr:hypothetical protein [Pseudomonadota bacterium]
RSRQIGGLTVELLSEISGVAISGLISRMRRVKVLPVLPVWAGPGTDELSSYLSFDLANWAKLNRCVV